MNTKINEQNYVGNLTEKEKNWLCTKPFGDYNLQESFLRIRDFSYIIELLALSNNETSTLLDLGCGSGWTSLMLAKLGVDVVGCDISKDMIEIAQKNAKKENIDIKFVVSDIEKISFENQFDRILIYDILHHCPDEVKVLQNAFKALKAGGLILVVEPGGKHQYDKEAQKIAKRFGVLEKGYKPSYLKKEMKKIGFKNMTQFFCGYGMNKPSPQSFKAFFEQLARQIAVRLFLANNQSQVWLTARK